MSKNMTDEEKEAEFEADTSNEDEEAEKEAELAERQKAEEAKKAEFDILLKKEKERREEAERKLETTRQKARERWEKNKQKDNFDDDEDDEEEKPLTKKDLHRALDEEREYLRKETRENRAKELANTLSDNSKEAELIVEIWKNRNLPGTLEEQIEEAHSIANSKKIKAQNEELKRALASKEGVEHYEFNSERKPAPQGEPKINSNDKQVLAGMVWDENRKAYKKKLANSSKLFFVSRDLKKRWVE